MGKLVLSDLPKVWLIDLDGTLVKHNGYMNGGDILIEGTREFFRKISPMDRVLILTSRSQTYQDATIAFLKENDIRFDGILFDMPVGERVLINDRKPSGLATAYGINKNRDEPFYVEFEIDDSL